MKWAVDILNWYINYIIGVFAHCYLRDGLDWSDDVSDGNNVASCDVILRRLLGTCNVFVDLLNLILIAPMVSWCIMNGVVIYEDLINPESEDLFSVKL